MKKLVICILLLVLSTVSFAGTKTGRATSPLRFDFTGYVGITPSGNKLMPFDPYMSYDICGKNILCGVGFAAGEGAYHDNKTVHVNSYTRVQNGKTVHVKSYMRSRPGSGGGSNTDFKIHEMFIGYYFHCASLGKSRLYVSPILGLTDARTDGGDALYGAVMKLAFNGFGFGIKGTNTAVAVGISYSVF